MASATLDLAVEKGEDIVFTGTHQVSATDATVVDISGWTIVVTVKTADGVLLYTLAGTVVSGAAGTYSWPLTHTQTNIASKYLQVDIWRTDSGSQREMAKGRLFIGPDVLYGV